MGALKRQFLRGVRRWPASTTALAVLLVAAAGLSLAHRDPRLALSDRAALAAVLRNPASAKLLRQVRWARTAVDAVDTQLERVTFYEGEQIVFQAAVRADRQVTLSYDFSRRPVPYGSVLAYEPGVLAGLSILFVLAAGVAPLRRRRNIDVLAMLSFVAAVVLLQHRYVTWSVLAALPGLGYLIGRCLWAGLGPGTVARPSTPLYLALTRRWDPDVRLRVLRMVVAAIALVFLAVGVSSTGAVDVIYGVMEGATKLVHGVLPYGHMPGDVVHGDTYPLFSYLFYTPVALLSPVSSTWDSVDWALGATVAVALGTALMLAAVNGPRLRMPARARKQPAAGAGSKISGLLAALRWLSFPPLLITVSTGTTDVALAAMLLAAVLLWQRPATSSAVLACAGWFKLAPFALVPVWLAPLRGRRLIGAVASLAAVSLAAAAVLIGLAGAGGIRAMIHAIGFQLERGSFQSPWEALGLSSLQPVGQACVLAMIAGAVVRLRGARKPFPRDRMAALSAAILLGLQVTADYWSFLYLVWIVPLVGVSLLSEPVCAAEQAPVSSPAPLTRALAPEPVW